MSELTLAKSLKIISAAFSRGKDLGLKPLAVVVLDTGGHVKAFQRQDGASMLRFEIASGKAYGCLAVGAGGRWLQAQAESRPHFIEGLTAVSGNRILAVRGGVLVKDPTGDIVGAVGVSGDTSDNDEICAIAGIEGAEFLAEAG